MPTGPKALSVQARPGGLIGPSHIVVWWQRARGENLTGGIPLVLELPAREEPEDRGLALGSRAH
jgi:hypothetical protein